MRKQQHTLGLSVGDVLHKIIRFITVQKSAITVICKRLRPDMIFLINLKKLFFLPSYHIIYVYFTRQSESFPLVFATARKQRRMP